MSQATATASGSVVRKVSCESCSTEYEYEAKRVASGSHNEGNITIETARENAQKDADQKLATALKEAVDIVACPECGAITREMKQERQSTILGTFGLAGACALIFLVTYAVGKFTGHWFIFPLVVGAGGFLIISIIIPFCLKKALLPRKGNRLPPAQPKE